MNKKLYFGIGVVILIILIGGGIYYWQSQKSTGLPTESEVSYEEKSLEQDAADLEELSQDASLDALEGDLTEIAGETVSEIENLESELSSELESFSADLSDLEGFENDSSLDNLDSGLSQVAE